MKKVSASWLVLLFIVLIAEDTIAQNAKRLGGPQISISSDEKQYRQGKTIFVESSPVVLNGLPVHGVWQIQQQLSDGRTRFYAPELQDPVLSGYFPEASHWCICPESGRLIACKRTYQRKEDGHDFLLFTDAEGKLILKEDPKRYFHHNPDSLIMVQVFYPNPVVSRNESYGKRLRDLNDMNSHWLDSALVVQPLRLKKSELGILPASELFRFAELSLPFRGHPFQNVTDTRMRRGDEHFEFFNVLFHLENAAQLIREKDYPQLLNELVFDPHALNDRDQSAFNPFAVPPSLEFGTGGVDDGEDAQVIAHEFAHALSHQASPHSFSGKQRKMIEEGNADFWAMYYSQRLSPHRSYEVFSWDGHNEYWEGFDLSRKEDFSLLHNPDVSDGREIWASCLRCMARELGWEYTAEIMLESMFYQRPEMTLESMGRDLLLIDTLLGQGRRYHEMKSCLLEYGILPADYRDVPENNTGPGKLINTEGFAHAGEDAYMILKEPMNVQWKIFDLSGRLLRSARSEHQTLVRIEGDQLPKGILFLEASFYSPDGNLIEIQQFRLFKAQ